MPMVGQHIARGMSGLIVVDREEGPPKVDRKFNLMRREIYTAGASRGAGPAMLLMTPP
ncbi:MAG TPA: hypothetical protein VGE72_11350 [Azospirillum sp.]